MEKRLVCLRRDEIHRIPIQTEVPDGWCCLRQRIVENADYRFGLGCFCVPVFRTGVSANAIRPRTDFFEFCLSLIQPDADWPNGGGTDDDEVTPAVVINVGCLEA